MLVAKEHSRSFAYWRFRKAGVVFVAVNGRGLS